MRGDIYEMRFDGRGHVVQGQRMAVALQNEDLWSLSTWLVAPTSSSDSANAAIFRPEFEVEGRGPGRILLEQSRVVDVDHLGPFVGRLTNAQLQAVDAGLRFILDLL